MHTDDLGPIRLLNQVVQPFIHAAANSIHRLLSRGVNRSSTVETRGRSHSLFTGRGRFPTFKYKSHAIAGKPSEAV